MVKLLNNQKETPFEIITDKFKSYAAANKEIMPSVNHTQDRYANNRAENSHQRTRKKERQIRGFKSHKHAQKMLFIHGKLTIYLTLVGI